MDASKQARFKELTEELAALLYEESDPEELKTLEGIETGSVAKKVETAICGVEVYVVQLYR